MAHLQYLWIVVLIACIQSAVCQLSNNKDDLLNWCLDSVNHKHKPGKEDTLHEQCLPWKDHACCTNEVAIMVHETNLYNFSLDHCFSQTGSNMSDKCRRHFNQNNCFYECEPHIGLWVVKTKRKIATERFYKVPLCASDCISWFEACKDDFTCAYNWPRDFKFSKGHNTCKEKAKCNTFKQVYETAKDFCENVWDDSWVYTPDDQPCMRIWFNGSSVNPNRKIAEYYINKHFDGGSVNTIYIWLIFLSLISHFSWTKYSSL
ncbi:folate receptor alpha-like isoform X2 [Stegodyphus dumicola]|uniref:folate receptor alpha-like isoform X2 n=1 Tax=Stegodyphus dumicola TaxID=202533 RepID=UPI0015A8FC93|nr:folate receptor alpha-like isoform X2 [Stegodyphus dumicola]